MTTTRPWMGPTIAVAVLALMPFAVKDVGLLSVMAIGLIFAAVAVTYDLLLGFTGLLSFGHALFFGASVYITGIALTAWSWALPGAIALAVIATTVIAVVTGAVANRVKAVSFAMVTLAFAESGLVLVQRNPRNLTNGADGFGVDLDRVPDFLVGVANTRYLFWLSLIVLIIIYVAVWAVTTSSPGRVLQGLRDNEQRVQVIGLRPYTFKLLSFVIAGFLVSIAGATYAIVQGGVEPRVMTGSLSLTVLVMAVLGGLGYRWGAALGGFLYTFANVRLTALSSAEAFDSLPLIIRGPLKEPVFILGTLFILIVLFAPGGIAGGVTQFRIRRAQRKVSAQAGVSS
jgi:branched-chain amino acid transport system permease protein